MPIPDCEDRFQLVLSRERETLLDQQPLRLGGWGGGQGVPIGRRAGRAPRAHGCPNPPS